MSRTFLLSLVIIVMFSGCNLKAPSIEGLWLVQSVEVGEDEMTPNARWTRFNEDGTQESGNGGFQHSYGTSSFNSESSTLSIVNTNGFDDPYEDFVVALEGNKMTWKRTEEGQDIKVRLVRTSTLPQSYGDQVLGLWQLNEAEGKGRYFDEADNEEAINYIFFRWDKRFVIQSGERRTRGVYNVHGHKPELELIPYGAEVERDFWAVDFEGNGITLKLLNSDSTVSRSFKRLREFPN